MADRAVGGGWLHWRGDDEGVDADWVSALATVTGTAGKDFIHRAGDGLVAPAGYTDIAQATTGDDIIDGGKGKDIIYGDAGRDIIYGGGGADHIYGGAGFDEFRITSTDEIAGLREYMDGGEDGAGLIISCPGNLDLTKATLIDVTELSLNNSGFENLLLKGNQLDGFTLGIDGGASSSISLTTKAHYDGPTGGVGGLGTINGSPDNDYLHFTSYISSYAFDLTGGGGDDDLKIAVDGRFSPHSSYHSFTLDGGEGNDTLTLFDGLGTLTGDAGDDKITGGKQADMIDGGADNDVLKGGGKDDTLTGGSGADLFVYDDVKDSKPGAGADTITDFSHAEGDRIDLSKIDADTTQAGDQAFHLVAGGAFTGHGGELIQSADGSNHTLVQGDVNGDGQADFALLLTGTPVLVAEDFVL